MPARFLIFGRNHDMAHVLPGLQGAAHGTGLFHEQHLEVLGARHLWLLTCTENLDEVEHTKGFVLQIQQGTAHEKSHMQKAEKISGRIPRIAVFCVEGARNLIGGGTLAKKFMDTAVAQAEEQWRNGFEAKLQMCSEFYEAVAGTDKVQPCLPPCWYSPT